MEVTDSYQEYLRARRERSDIEKIATLSLPVSELSSIYLMVAEIVDTTEGLPSAAKQRWESILRSMRAAIEEVA